MLESEDSRLEAVPRLFIVPHTHWDREWVRAFQTFRKKPVNLVDDLLATTAHQRPNGV